MAAESASQIPVVFEDVAVYFSPEEWAQLAEWQKELYQDVMEDTFELVASLGSVPPPKPALLCKMEQGEEPCVVDPPPSSSSSRAEEREACGGPSSADWGGSVQPQVIKEEAVAPGSWSPTAFPEGRVPGPDFRSLERCPSWCEVKLTDLRSVLQGPSWAGGGSLEPGTVSCEELLICTECGETFEEIEALSGHQARLHAGEPGKGPLVCPACGKCFRSRLNLLAHKKHRGKSRHSCSRCPAVCCLRGDLLRHRAAHTAQGGHPCGLCGLVFQHRGQLLAHKGEHGGGPAHQCPICSAALGSPAELREHRAAHQEERPFACRQCGERFSWKESLQVHQGLRHAQERGYSCPTCQRSFSRRGNLLAHQRLHTGELSFACPECERSFPTKASLMAHRRLHLRARPSACQHCGRGFRSQEKLRQHQASHGGSGEQQVKQEVKQEAGEP